MFTTAIESMSKDPDIGVVAVVCPLPTAADTLPWRGMPMARAIGAGVELASCPVVWVNQVMVPSNATVRAVMERSEEHTSELQSLMRISYAVFCLKKKKKKITNH